MPGTAASPTSSARNSSSVRDPPGTAVCSRTDCLMRFATMGPLTPGRRRLRYCSRPNCVGPVVNDQLYGETRLLPAMSRTPVETVAVYTVFGWSALDGVNVAVLPE